MSAEREPTREEWRDWSRAIEPDSPKKLRAAELWMIRAMQNTTDEQRNVLSAQMIGHTCTCECPVHGRGSAAQGLLMGATGMFGGRW